MTAPNRRTRRATLPRRRHLLAATLSLATALTLADAATDGLAAHEDPPRAFGYTVGDVVSRRIALQVPDDLRLDADSLPRAGGRGRALELQRAVLHTARGGRPDALTLDYQVFLAPRDLRVLEMPPVVLRFTGARGPQTLRIDAWPVTVAPLTATEPSPREGLGDLRPDRAPPPIDTRAARQRLLAEAAVGALLLAYLANVYLVQPGLASRRRPFGRAWGAVKALPARPAPAERRAAFGHVHAALNATAGRVVFAGAIDDFLARAPRFAPLRAELATFFQRSRDEFFADGGAAVETDARWLVALARRCRDLERGAA